MSDQLIETPTSETEAMLKLDKFLNKRAVRQQYVVFVFGLLEPLKNIKSLLTTEFIG